MLELPSQELPLGTSVTQPRPLRSTLAQIPYGIHTQPLESMENLFAPQVHAHVFSNIPPLVAYFLLTLGRNIKAALARVKPLRPPPQPLRPSLTQPWGRCLPWHLGGALVQGPYRIYKEP